MLAAFDALDAKVQEGLLFDAVYIDEAQDLTPEEIRFLLRLARRDEHGGQTFVLFYDNAQNIYGVKPPVWHDLGVNIVGRTVFLDQCLRNTRQTLDFALNVLVGSHAAEGQRVATKQFADVQSLRQRGLVEEKDGRIEVYFSPRSGPPPQVVVYPNRQAEIDGTVDAVRKLLAEQRVIPSDVLILYQSHWPYKDTLPKKLEQVVGSDCRVRLVDKEHEANKKHLLIEDGVMAVSTIASAKGYDAPIVFLLGADELGVEVEDRATFYVRATRAKLHLVVSGARTTQPTLLTEIVAAASALTPESVTHVPPAVPKREDRAKVAEVQRPSHQQRPMPDRTQTPHARCRHCGSERLHAQHGKFGYFFRCIDCTGNTPIDATCPWCGKKSRIRKAGNDFFRECEGCGSSLLHTNVSLHDFPG